MRDIKNLKPNFNARTEQGYYICKTGKYRGQEPIIYRSSWELHYMRRLDSSPNIAFWCSEPVTIPYMMREVVNGKYVAVQHHYSPDFLIEYTDGKRWLIEIKPYSQSPNKNHTKEEIETNPILYKNYRKWLTTIEWCKRNGMQFKVLTEKELKIVPANRKLKSPKRKI